MTQGGHLISLTKNMTEGMASKKKKCMMINID